MCIALLSSKSAVKKEKKLRQFGAAPAFKY
jgi:hypothetical protein